MKPGKDHVAHIWRIYRNCSLGPARGPPPHQTLQNKHFQQFQLQAAKHCGISIFSSSSCRPPRREKFKEFKQTCAKCEKTIAKNSGKHWENGAPSQAALLEVIFQGHDDFNRKISTPQSFNQTKLPPTIFGHLQ